MGDDDVVDGGFAARVGGRLRALRRQKGLTLQEVEANSDLEFKASVLGAYERGERAISVPRLQRLASFYAVPLDQLLPRENGEGTVIDLTDDRPTTPSSARVTIDLVSLRSFDAPGKDLLVRYLEMIQVQRQDFNGRVLTLRGDDLRAIACLLDTPTDEAGSRLRSLGLCLAG